MIHVIMKRCWFTVLFLLSVYAEVQSQTIIAAEYFFDTDPGYGSGIPFPAFTAGATATPMISNESMASLSYGYHTLYFRTQDSDKHWSHTGSKRILKERNNFANNKVVKVEYFLGSHDLGIEACPSVAFATPLANGEVTINFPNFPLGYDTLVFRVMDANGVWSHTQYIDTTFITSVNKPMLNGSFSLFPNPTSGSFTIHSDKLRAGDRLEILDAVGLLVTEQTIHNQSETIHVKLAAGLYQVRILGADGKRYMEKLVIQK